MFTGFFVLPVAKIFHFILYLVLCTRSSIKIPLNLRLMRQHSDPDLQLEQIKSKLSSWLITEGNTVLDYLMGLKRGRLN